MLGNRQRAQTTTTQVVFPDVSEYDCIFVQNGMNPTL